LRISDYNSFFAQVIECISNWKLLFIIKILQTILAIERFKLLIVWESNLISQGYDSRNCKKRS